MGRRRYTDEDKERAIQLYAVNGNVEYTAQQIGMPRKTLERWIKRDDASADIAELRHKKRIEFADRAGAILDDLADTLAQRVRVILDSQAEIDQLIDVVMDDEDMTYKERKDIARKLSRIAAPGLSEIATTLGIIYDKRALAMGEATQNIGQSITTHEMSAEDIAQALDQLRDPSA